MKCFYSLIEGLPFAFVGCNGSTEKLVSLLRVHRRKKDLWDPRMPLQEGKRNEKSALAGLRGRKSRARPENAEKMGLEIDFHEPDPSMGKISLHNTKKHAIEGLGGRKSRARPENAEKMGLES